MARVAALIKRAFKTGECKCVYLNILLMCVSFKVAFQFHFIKPDSRVSVYVTSNMNMHMVNGKIHKRMKLMPRLVAVVYLLCRWFMADLHGEMYMNRFVFVRSDN